MWSYSQTRCFSFMSTCSYSSEGEPEKGLGSDKKAGLELVLMFVSTNWGFGGFRAPLSHTGAKSRLNMQPQ